jgi:hypothetical protein
MRLQRQHGFVVCACGVLAALAGVVVACDSTPPPKVASTTPGGSKDPNKWPADDHSMCDWKNKPELEVSETAGPGAFKPNVRRVYKVYGESETRHKTLICREIDTNLDGIKDVVRTFNAKGEALHEEADTDYDGKIDVWVDFVDGRMSIEKIDTKHSGKPDVWKYYVNGQLSRVQRDTNGDGKPDVWEIYTKSGHLERMGIDNNHDGHVDRWDRDEDLQRAAENEEIKARQALMGDAGAGATSTTDDGGAAAAADAGPKAGQKSGRKK